MRHKLPAERSIGIDKSEQVIEYWRKNYPGLAEYVNGDAIDFLSSYAFTGTELVYCDPPYVPSTRKRARVYEHDLNDDDHDQLLETLLHLPCFVVLSGYTSAIYQSKLNAWNTRTFTTKAHDGVRQEWIWTNYVIPDRLHDIRYYGANYRERQNFKRRIRRLQERILRLSKPEQHHLAQWLSDQLISLPDQPTTEDENAAIHVCPRG